MPDSDLFNELDQKTIELIFDYRQSTSDNKNASEELLKTKENIKKLFNVIPPLHVDILQQKFLFKLTNNQISENTKKPEEEIEKIISDAIKTIKSNLKNGDLITDINTIQQINKKEENPKGKFDENIFFEKTENKIDIPKIKQPSALGGLFKFIAFLFFIIIFIFGYNFLQKSYFTDLPTLLPLEKASNSIPYLNKTSKEKINPSIENEIRISGSSSLNTLSKRWENSFNIEFPQYKIKITPSDSDQGINDLILGKYNVANSSRPLFYTDINLAEENNLELFEHRVAIDAIIVIVNNNNNIESLSLEELEKIFSGNVNNWSLLNASNLLITPVIREEGSGTTNFFRNRLLRGNNFSTSTKTFSSNSQIIDFVSENPGAIAFLNSTNYSWDNENIKYVKIKTYGTSDSISPYEGKRLNENAIRYGDYPLAHYLYLITSSNQNQAVKDYIDWIKKEEAQKIVSQLGLIPILENY